MVVIQAEESNKVDPPTSKSEPSRSANANRDASDGFETASDTELPSDDDAGNGNGNNDGGASSSGGNGPPQANSDSALIDDEQLKQKALAEANDAKSEGNKLFGDGLFEEAMSQYDLALQVAPDMPSSVELRSICYSNRAICFLKLGKYEETIKECTKALELNPTYMKALARRGEAHEKLEHYEEAIADMKKILELDPSNDQAKRTIRRLQPLAEEKREKMKEEMLGKLKEMGNSVLGRFGMSVDNFKAVKDPNTGSYSISFQR